MRTDAIRRHGSVFLLAARGSLHWTLLLLLVMAVVETGLFVRVLPFMEGAQFSYGGEGYPFEGLIAESGIRWVFTGVLLAFLLLATRAFADKQGYTLSRVSMREGAVIFWQFLYHFICYLIFWGMQLLLLLGFLQLYLGRVDPSLINHQSVMLSFYRDDFLHSILPLAHTGVYIRNFALFFFMALWPAYSLFQMRVNPGKTSVANVLWGVGVWTIWIFILWFPVSLDCLGTIVFTCVFALGTLIATVFTLRERRKSYEREAKSL